MCGSNWPLCRRLTELRAHQHPRACNMHGRQWTRLRAAPDADHQDPGGKVIGRVSSQEKVGIARQAGADHVIVDAGSLIP